MAASASGTRLTVHVPLPASADNPSQNWRHVRHGMAMKAAYTACVDSTPVAHQSDAMYKRKQIVCRPHDITNAVHLPKQAASDGCPPDSRRHLASSAACLAEAVRDRITSHDLRSLPARQTPVVARCTGAHNGRTLTHVGRVKVADGDAHAVDDVLVGRRQVHGHVQQRVRVVEPLRHLPEQIVRMSHHVYTCIRIIITM